MKIVHIMMNLLVHANMYVMSIINMNLEKVIQTVRYLYCIVFQYFPIS